MDTATGRNADGGYVAEWRRRVDGELEESAKAHQQAAIIQERVLGRLDDHDRRIKALEVSPASLRSSFGTYGGCIGQVIFAVLSGLGVLISLVALIITPTR